MAAAASTLDFDSEDDDDDDDGAIDAQISSWEYDVAGDKELQQLLGQVGTHLEATRVAAVGVADQTNRRKRKPLCASPSLRNAAGAA
jgi:hypothetical protein